MTRDKIKTLIKIKSLEEEESDKIMQQIDALFDKHKLEIERTETLVKQNTTKLVTMRTVVENIKKRKQ